ncbi:MAG: hypothetical protein J7623_01745 [Chitinophaga sp.]|uniref:hypothetical protein n=1 Tax=Chitinophaga sp. TaxID=1869181 RepID=UPI001B243FE4|nr:hypothetical protein [Chitinophaga sp.]MBO9727339.1 hypothetical protein [Chitinophaga sp.]
MEVLNIKTGQYEDARISLLQKNELTKSEKKRFDFEWEQELIHNVYKQTLFNDDSILGLMSVLIYEAERRVEIKLLELARENRGKTKLYDRVAGNLITFACQLSFKSGFDGFVSLIPKTELISHYIEKYHFRPVGKHLVLEGSSSDALITEYIKINLNESKEEKKGTT